MDRFRIFQIKDYTYRVDKYIVLVTFLILLSIVGYILYFDNFSGELKYYSECPESSFNVGGCFNAFYNSNLCKDGSLDSFSPICTTEHMLPGQAIGIKPPFLITYFNEIGFGIVLLMIIINNFLYNKDFISYVKKLMGDNNGSN